MAVRFKAARVHAAPICMGVGTSVHNGTRLVE
jgi:hypothetical protein